VPAALESLLPELVAFAALAGVMAYAVLGGADFGGGIWDLLASGPRAAEQRRAVTAAIGPVWEANHVWLIFVIVLLFTAFPAAFAALSLALFVPFHLVLLGIILRGAAFVFRGHVYAAGLPTGWSAAFGAASAFTPFVLGTCLGAVSTGRLRVADGAVSSPPLEPWLDPFALACGALALALCAYLAAVYLTVETDGALRADFRRRALGTWLVAGAISIAALLLARTEAPRLWSALLGPQALPALLAGLALAPLSAWALVRHHYRLARTTAAGQVVALLAGWALAQWPYIIYPDVTLHGAAAPTPTLALVLLSLPPGLALLLPSLWFLFRVFKTPPAASPSTPPATEPSAQR
jgi:cytochrome d ubiquinol oxidase subunit II